MNNSMSVQGGFASGGKKILILGASGNLGMQLQKVFKESDVIAWDRTEIDVTDKELLQKKIGDIKPDVIINCAAYNAVDKCEGEKESEISKKINGEVPGWLAEIALELDAVLVHYSSDYVFAGDKQDGYSEDDKPFPVNKYGETKLQGEHAILKIRDNLKYYIIRTSKLFGPRGKSEVAKSSFFDIMLKLAKERESIDVVDEEVSLFTYTPDLAQATRDLIESDKDYGIYHITNSGSCTWYEATKKLFEIAEIDTKINPVGSDKFPRLAKRPKYSVLLNTKLKPMRSWQEALREYLNK